MNGNNPGITRNKPIADDSFEYVGEPVTLLSVFWAVLKHPWILGGSLVLILAPLLFYLQGVKTFYRSSSTVMVSVRESSFLDAMSLVEGRRSDVKSEKYYTSILDSRMYRDEITADVAAMHPEMRADSINGTVRFNIGYTTNRQNPGFIRIYATSQSQDYALLLARTALEKFKSRSIKLEREDALHVARFIDTQIDNISTKLELAEEELQTFLAEKKLLVSGSETGITQELFELERKHNEAKANLEMINININSYEQKMNELLIKLSGESQTVDQNEILLLKDRLSEISNSLRNAEEENLSPADIQTLKAERDQLRNSLIGLVTTPTSADDFGGVLGAGVTIQQLEEELEASLLKQTEYSNQVQFYKLQIQRFRSDHPNLSEDILMFAGLSRAKEVLQKTSDILLEKREEIRIRLESEMGGIKVIDAPRRPEQPLSRKRTQKLIYGIVAALVLGLTISVIVERFDNTIKDETDIQRNFGLSVFGSLPSLDSNRYVEESSRDKKKKAELTSKSKNPGLSGRMLKAFSEKSPTAEAYRSLKIAIQFLSTDKGKSVFVVSSPSVSEGKSLTTANLGISFAQGGHKTLIIDCDLRKTVQHKHFDLDRKPGLTNYMYDEMTLGEVIRETGVPNLHIITGGKSPSNPAELLASQKMTDMLKEMREKYDFVLIDTPPVLVCSDSRVLAEKTDGMIMIVKVESTNIKALGHAINLTKHLNIELLGVVLNQVGYRFGRAYYYTYRYYRPYSYYSGYYYKRKYYEEADAEVNDGAEKTL